MFVKCTDAPYFITTSPFKRQGDDCLLSKSILVLFWFVTCNCEIKDIKNFCVHNNAGEKHTLLRM